MSLATLKEVLDPALAQGYAVAGLVTLGWEDMLAYVAAGEALGHAIILQAGPSCRAHTPLPVLGKMYRHLAETARVPVVAHLDHGYEIDEVKLALDSGFTSVMYDGSRMPLAQNIAQTAAVADLAAGYGASVEGEIGFVGYAEGENSDGTDVAEAHQFARDSGVDAMAISVGNVHLQQQSATRIDRARLAEIEAGTNLPLVIHGGSGVHLDDKQELSRHSAICKWNIGTELRMAFGASLRAAIAKDPTRFDRVQILSETVAPLTEKTKEVLALFRDTAMT